MAGVEVNGVRLMNSKPMTNDVDGRPQIGEISSVADMENLANEIKGVSAAVVDEAACLGVQAVIKKFYSKEELWRLIVDEVDKGHAIIMPYACAGVGYVNLWL